MAITPLRMLLFLGGASAAAVGTAYTVGAFDPLLAPAAVMSSTADPQDTELPSEQKPVENTTEPKPEQQAAVEPDAGKSAQANTTAAPEPLVPSFDLLRAEPDGSVVIAGKAAPNADIEILAAGTVLGKTKATPEGDFAVVLNQPLKPGDYQLSLRSTTQTKAVADSRETAVVSIPATKDGEVLAMVEQPGTASRIITKPAAPTASAASTPQPPADTSPKPADTAGTKPAEATVAVAPAAPEQAAAGKETVQADAPHVPVAVEAVEIEGRKLFVAGAAGPGAPIRIYANDKLLGETRASPEGRFLLEVERDLPVGDYRIRADAVTADGAKVVARAEVGFNREPGQTVAAVVPAGPSASKTAPAGAAKEPTASATVSVTTPVQPTPTDATPASPDPSVAVLGTEAGKSSVTPADPAAEDETSADAQPPAQSLTPLAPGGLDQPPKLQTVSGGVIIRRGDSLWRISRRVYGRGVRYSTIYLANNTQIRDPHRIYPGQIFRVPEKTTEGEAADMKAMGEQATTSQ